MTREEIKAAAMKASKDYGYDWVMADYEYEDADETLDWFKKQMEDGKCQVCIEEGEEPYYALDRHDVEGVNLYDVMEEGEIFSEGNVYRWITLGRIKAWKEILGKNVGYFCNGYTGWVFDPEKVNVYMLKREGEVVMEAA